MLRQCSVVRDGTSMAKHRTPRRLRMLSQVELDAMQHQDRLRDIYWRSIRDNGMTKADIDYCASVLEKFAKPPVVLNGVECFTL